MSFGDDTLDPSNDDLVEAKAEIARLKACVADLEDKNEALTDTLEDEQVAHADTLRLKELVDTRLAELEKPVADEEVQDLMDRYAEAMNRQKLKSEVAKWIVTSRVVVQRLFRRAQEAERERARLKDLADSEHREHRRYLELNHENFLIAESATARVERLAKQSIEVIAQLKRNNTGDAQYLVSVQELEKLARAALKEAGAEGTPQSNTTGPPTSGLGSAFTSPDCKTFTRMPVMDKDSTVTLKDGHEIGADERITMSAREWVKQRAVVAAAESADAAYHGSVFEKFHFGARMGELRKAVAVLKKEGNE